ncbi:hypothetical protein L798_09915 [Zootermopsis nevadensis]|uniref:Uncharacterized protein n=1 Tax=Zootermopsis nevadensis TaxID=136037 RepID=A0A067R120_ZOONE|nr:hypothetical protein L798_09915 [Zootermopsis nevadensis]
MSECTEDGDSTSEWWSSTYKTTKCHNPEHHHQGPSQSVMFKQLT